MGLELELEHGLRDPTTNVTERAPRPQSDGESVESRRGSHPGEEGEPTGAPGVPEDADVVPGRHSASAEAAWLRWRERGDDS
jgi:hypothetical protein